MGNCHEDLITHLQQAQSQKTVIESPILSPSPKYALKLPEKSLDKLCPDLMSAVQKVKAEEKFQGVFATVQACPIYYIVPLNCLYQGQWENQLPHGQGVAIYKNSSYYEGEFSKGQLEDADDALYLFGCNYEKTEIFQTKTQISKSDRKESPDIKTTYYIGKFVNSKFHGKGKMYHRGVIYEGEWFQGRRQGEGSEYTTQLAYIYTGPFANGFKYGDGGVYKCRINGDSYCYEGSFYAGLFHGRGKLAIEERICFSGKFLNGRAEGEGELICDIGVLTCNFKKDRVSGEGEFRFNDANREKVKGEFKDEVGQDPRTHKAVRRILFNGTEIAEAPFIDFRTLIVETA